MVINKTVPLVDFYFKYSRAMAFACFATGGTW